jgi:hypothetical protein
MGHLKGKPENCIDCQCKTCQADCPCICNRPYGCLAPTGDCPKATTGLKDWLELHYKP